jgi:hypothetical protein
MGKQVNAQREAALLADWLGGLPPTWASKTHVRVGQTPLFYQGTPLPFDLSKLAQNWADWADARVFTGSEVWIVEAKIVGTAGAYGQIIDYLDEYPLSDDARQFVGVPLVGVVLCQASKPRTAALFGRYGIRTIVHQPNFPFAASFAKISPALSGV